jgi:hypothetical protein
VESKQNRIISEIQQHHQDVQLKGRSRSSNLRSKADRSDKVSESAGKKKREMVTME